MKLCMLFLTCANEIEAETIAQTLLDKKLIVCVKKLPVQSAFLWKGVKDSAKEVLLILDSVEEFFEEIQQEVKKLHSYKTFVLFSTPITQTTSGVREWFDKELQK